jgi:FkbM family methyltransferase
MFPKVIWMLWLQGWPEAPDIVRACRRSWEALNPGWIVAPLSEKTAFELLRKRGSEFVQTMTTKELPPEALSDCIRIELLRHGGVWADATTYCLKPLDDWLFQNTASGFFAFANPGPDRLISSWFLVASPNNTIVSIWSDAVRQYWSGRTKRDEYFWFHYLFGNCYHENSEFRELWDQAPKIPSDGPHYYEPDGGRKLLLRFTEIDRELISGTSVPMLKLRFRLPGNEEPNSVLQYLLRLWSDPSIRPAVPVVRTAAPDNEVPFFPNQPPSIMRLEERLRAGAEEMPQTSRFAVYETFSKQYSTLTSTIFATADRMVIASQRGTEIAFPDPLPLIKFSHIVCGYEEWLQRKYCFPGFVEVEVGDIVVDCGAYVGGFSLSAAHMAAEVHAFEPDAANFACVLRNHKSNPNVVCNPLGLHAETAVMDFNISSSSVEHSFLMPDNGPPVRVEQAQVIRLDHYYIARNLPRLDFVKIEAEGVELEVFDGLGTIRPAKLAIDVSPERNGESPAEEFRVRLEASGYEIRQRGHVMFARRSDARS